jgi:hypothetical protein
MSIAVSVIVGPSRVHRLLCLAWGLAQAGAAWAVGVAVPARFPGAPWLALLLACTAAGLMHSAVRRPKTHRIDISGTGDLRVTVQQDVGGAGSVAALSGAAVSGANVPANLLTGSVLWPMLAVLRYAPRDAAEDMGVGATASVLPVWRDSVDPAAWRGLAVALAVIGRRCGGEGFDKIR